MFGRRALTYAASEEQAETVLALIELGANVEAIDESGQTAESHATRRGHDGIVRLIRMRRINEQILA